ncbi:MAG: cupin domain-containing protein [Nitrospina sp.]|nr:cupin domain-containing protein [Nitrospina sp.]
MTNIRLALCTFIFVSFALPILSSAGAAHSVTLLKSQDLSGLKGKEGALVTVSYAPGESSPMHRHNAHTFVYVLEGSIVMQVKGGKPVTLNRGDTFYESPEDIHSVSKNASDSHNARFLVFFVKAKGAPSVLPVK